MSFKKTVLANVFVCLVSPLWSAGPAAASPPAAVVMTVDHQGQPVLRDFIDRIWSQSPAVQAASAAVAAARARRQGAARAIYNPSLQLDAERTAVSTLSVGISQTIDWGDKRAAQVAIARSEILAAEAGLMATRQAVAVETLAALARYQTAQAMQVLALHRMQLMKRFSDTVQRRYQAGDMRALDAALARLAYSEALMQQASTGSELAESEAALRAVSGLDFPAWPQLPQQMMSVPDKGVLGTVTLAQLPALQVLKHRMEQARAGIHLARGKATPDPTIGIRGGRDGSSGLFGVNLEIPLFVRNNFSAEVQAASHEVTQAEDLYRDALRRARARLEGSLGRFENMSLAWQAWLLTGQQAHVEQMALLEQLWQAGELTATDYLIQAKQSVDTEAAAKVLVGEVWQATITWLDASGRIAEWLGLTMRTTNSGEARS